MYTLFGSRVPLQRSLFPMSLLRFSIEWRRVSYRLPMPPLSRSTPLRSLPTLPTVCRCRIRRQRVLQPAVAPRSASSRRRSSLGVSPPSAFLSRCVLFQRPKSSAGQFQLPNISAFEVSHSFDGLLRFAQFRFFSPDSALGVCPSEVFPTD